MQTRAHDIQTSDLHKSNRSCTMAVYVYVCMCLDSCVERSCRRFARSKLTGCSRTKIKDLGKHRSSIRSSRMVVTKGVKDTQSSSILVTCVLTLVIGSRLVPYQARSIGLLMVFVVLRTFIFVERVGKLFIVRIWRENEASAISRSYMLN